MNYKIVLVLVFFIIVLCFSSLFTRNDPPSIIFDDALPVALQAPIR